jgi:protein involved in polysaccharide export with SLBB domain
MINFKLIIYCITSALILNSCSKILEPVSLFEGNQDVTSEMSQEEFEINIKSLTFDMAKNANNASYSRSLILTGSGSKANVVDEAKFLKSNFPKTSRKPQYLLGIGDQISLTSMNEFMIDITQWPDNVSEPEYILGIGDELIFAKANDSTIIYNDEGKLAPATNSDTLISTTGVIGSNGNILLFGLGNISAANRTLEEIRTEVRNILIRNGQTPTFQLEISNFKSKKAFLSASDGLSEVINLNNLPITLKDLALEAGLSATDENSAMVKLVRNEKEYRFTASQLFDLTAPEITIQDNDQIEAQKISKNPIIIESTVGLKGKLLLGAVGRITAVDRSIDDIYEDVSNILIERGIKPNLQVELIGFASKKAYLIEKNKNEVKNKVIPLTNFAITLRELILKNKSSTPSNVDLSIISLKRKGQVFRMPEDEILDPKTQDIWVIDGDQIETENLDYKVGKVFTLSGAGNAQVVNISPSKRETLADILFKQGGALNNLSAKRSEVYLLRGKNPSVAYHLDAQNVSRILVAAKTELRPNDIVYVSDRPIISFSRALSEIVPLRILLRDIQNNKIP